MPSHLGRRFKGVSVDTGDSGDDVYVEVTDRTQTAEDALAALIEADVFDWADELHHDRIKPEPKRTSYKLGGDGDIACKDDDPDKLGEYWVFDITAAWKNL